MQVKIGQGGKINYDFSKWIVDAEEEVAQLPKSPMGSKVYVIRTGETWMADSLGVWYPVTNLNKAPIECDCVEESTIWTEIPVVD